ncbi:low molecular weight protein-tyrosine-phosphatase [Anaerocolumna xylanovorans]|uniref:protein-tyrosine-phosphatase n=1 Tax=Anaerocolumna xylanovorans DSM 12503 TaxID=1121345 RepID=A0A1M7Y509_9FIRM|nr:low molecular weight protein-tyrosine-phosphatase [Anaerocolumna xylanovorans]SHO47418.1 protein-tyrosine phosphatase [Anaerocolumna xylanovorans DSM 12503]
MIRVLFVCLGNICRSPMAEYVFKDMVKKRNLSDKFYIASAGTSDEEAGNGVHRGTKSKLKEVGIDTSEKRAVQLKKEDYSRFDYIIGMEKSNLFSMERIFGGDPEHKVMRLLDLASHPRDIADPWYTGNFDKTYEDVYEGCQILLEHICEREGISC